jgi:hypothetical protein
MQIKLVFQFCPCIFQQRDLSLYANNLSHRTVCKMHKWMAWKVGALQIPSEGVIALFFTLSVLLNHKTCQFFLQRCHYFLGGSAPGSRSLQLHMHILIKKFECNLISKSLNVLYLLVCFTVNFVLILYMRMI